MKVVFAIVLTFSSLISSAAFAAAKPVTVQCKFSEFKKPDQEHNLVNPYGGGVPLSYQAADGSTLAFDVMIETNQDDKNLIDMTLSTKDISGRSLVLVARGISEDSRKNNGLAFNIGAVGFKCGI